MAVLEKMRVKMGVFISVVIAIALLAFIVDPETLQNAISMFSSKYDVGEVNGKGISSQLFQKRLDYFQKIYQMTTGQTGSDEKTTEMINNSAWQNEIAQMVIIPNCEKAGLAVGDKELIDMSEGTDISPVIAREANFVGSDGAFDKDKLLQFIQQIPQDNSGNLKMYWDYLQESMTQDRMFTKYVTLLQKSTIVNKAQIHKAIADNNVAYNVDFVIKPIGFTPDSSIKVSNEDIRAYYEKIKKTLKQSESRDAEFVAFEVKPSQEDMTLAKKDIDKTFMEFQGVGTVDNMKAFLAKNSDAKFSDSYFKKGDLSSLSEQLDAFAATASAGAVLPVQLANNVYFAAKVMDVKAMPDSAFVKQIFVKNNEKEADSLINVINKGGNFAALAAQYAGGQQVPAGQEPGDIGWMTQQYMMPGFEKVLTAKAGDVFKVKSSYGWHVVKVSQVTKPVRKSQIAILSKEAVAGKETFANFYAQANDVVEKCGKDIKKFEQYARTHRITLYPVQNLAPGSKKVSSFDDVKELSRWIFENKENEVSPIISVNNKYFFVAAVKKIHEDGYATLKEVAPQIKNYLTMIKTGEHMAQVCKKTVGANPASLDIVANKLGLTVSSQNGVTFTSMTATQQLDPKFIGAIAAAANTTKVVGPVTGDVGVYYFQIKGKEKGAYFTENDAKQRSLQTFATLANYLPQIMEQDANVKDKRYKFY